MTLLFAILLAASEGVSAGQARTAAPGTLDAASTAGVEGVSANLCRADHAHSTLITPTGTSTQRTLQDWLGTISTIGNYVAKAGDTMTGLLTSPRIVITPTTNNYGLMVSATNTKNAIFATGSSVGVGSSAIYATGGGAKGHGVVAMGGSAESGLYAQGGASGGAGVKATGGANATGGDFTGTGSGAGVVCVGGATGVGGQFTASGTGLSGVYSTGGFKGYGGEFYGGAGDSTIAAGIYASGGAGVGVGSYGGEFYGGDTNGDGLYSIGIGTGAGGTFVGGDSNGSGVSGHGGLTGVGGTFTGGTNSYGIVCQGGANASGILTAGQGGGSGIIAYGGSSNGVGGLFTGGTTNGVGVSSTGRGTGAGGVFSSAGSGLGVLVMGPGTGAFSAGAFIGGAGGGLAASFSMRSATPAPGTINVSQTASCPSAPNNGDVWTCDAGLGVKVNGMTMYVGTPSSTSWTGASYAGFWAEGNLGDWSGAFAPAFYKDTAGFVHLRGWIARGLCGTSAMTLPVSNRPTAITAYTLSTTSTGSTGWATVDSAGSVTIYCSTNNYAFFLDGITFDTRP